MAHRRHRRHQTGIASPPHSSTRRRFRVTPFNPRMNLRRSSKSFLLRVLQARLKGLESNGSTQNHRGWRRPGRPRSGHQNRRSRRQRRSLLHRPRQALPLRLRPGRHQRRQESQGRRRHHRQALRRHHLWRRLPRQPDSRQEPCAKPRPPSSICSTAWACPSIAPPKACSTSAASAARSITAPPSPAPPPASSFSTRSTSRSAATRPKARSKSTRAGSSSPPSSTPKASARGITAMNLRTMELRAFPADAIILATGGIGAIFGKSTNSVVCTGSAQSAVFQQGAYYANGEFIQVHPTCHSRRRQAAPHVRVGPRRRRPRLGSAHSRRQAPRQADPRVRALLLPRGVVSQVRQPRPARRRHPRHSQGRLRARPRHRRPAHGLPRPHPHRPRHAQPQARRHPRNLREVRRRRSPRSAHEDLPRHALHHGRPLGRLQPDDQHPRHLCRRRVRVPVPRRQSPRRQLARQLHLRRIPGRPQRHRLRQEPARGRRRRRRTQPNSRARPRSTTASSTTRAPRIPSSSGASWARP